MRPRPYTWQHHTMHGARLEAKLDHLDQLLRSYERVAVAFSGGADSAFLTAAALRALGPECVHAVTAISPSLAQREHAECGQLAQQWGMRWTPVSTDEMERSAYRMNDAQRCWHCKSALMDVLEPIAAADASVIVLGVNVDDLGDHRPGQAAAGDRGARFPLVEAGFAKSDVREASRRWGLVTWDKPAAACLASRVPYGTQVTVSVLSRVDRAEDALRQLGFNGSLRVRHYDDVARLEVDVDALAAVIAQRDAVVQAVKAAGYRYVTLDLEGFRSGNLNGAL